MNFEKGQTKSLKVSQEESFAEKKEDLGLVKDILEERFGKEKLPKDLVLEMVSIRKEIRGDIEKENFVDEINETIDARIRLLVSKIHNTELKDEDIKEIVENKDGDIEVSFKNGEKVNLGQNEKELLFSLRLYFDSYRLAHNASKFRSNVGEIRDELVVGNANRRKNFFEESEKRGKLIFRLKEMYKSAGFSEEELGELIETCDLKDLDNLPIHKIKIMSKIKDIFARFMDGDKKRYIGLSVALMMPAFIEGYSPSLLASVFKKDASGHEQMVQMGLYILSICSSAGLSLGIQKYYKDLINKNYQKDKGMSDYIAHNLSEMPPNEISNIGTERVKRRAEKGRNSYDDVLATLSFDIFPTITTLVTSAIVLYQKSPILAGGTVLASSISIVLDRYFEKYGKFWEKESGVDDSSEDMAQKLNEQLNAHMEIILAGEKERFFSDVKEFLRKEKIAQSNQHFFNVLSNTFNTFSHSITSILAIATSVLSGGAPETAIAALVYVNPISGGIQKLLSTKRNLLKSLRSIEQMELTFNGSAEEEVEKEKTRVGVDKIKNGDINLKNVNVELDGQKILDDVSLEIPSGSMVYLEGASGAGKTTLMKVISGYLHPNSGEVKLGDVDVESIKKSGEGSIYSKIAYVSQFPYLFEGSLKNNLKFGLSGEVSDEKIKEVLKDVGLDKRFRDLNERLFSGSGNSNKTSGGETSRIGLARVLLKIRNNDCKLVFLDEPTASVDKKTKKEIARIINEEKAKKPETTFIVISHDESFVEMLNCNIKVEMEEGRIIEE